MSRNSFSHKKKFAQKNKKQAMAIGQVFIFIVAALTFALIMIFGYRTIAQFMHSGEEVQFVQFKTDLESAVKKIYSEYGSARIEKFYAPANYKQICFLDLDAPYDEGLCAFDSIACDAWQSTENYEKAQANVFLQPLGTKEIKVYKIKIAPEENANFICLNLQNGMFSLYLEGKGDHTQISRVALGVSS